MPLAVVTRSGTTPSCSQANQSPVRPKPVWISSATNTMPLLARKRRRAPRRKPGAGHDEAALALDRLDDDRGHVVGADLLVDQVDRPRRRLVGARSGAVGPAERVGHRHPVDLAARTARSPCLYGMFLAVSAIVRLVRPW